MTRQRHIRLAQGGLLLLSLSLASAARAQTAPPPPAYAPPPGYHLAPDAPARAPGAHTHDGFYLRLHLGVGYTSMSTSTMGADLSEAGASGSFGVALGGAVSPHLIVYGTLVDSVENNPTGKITNFPPNGIDHGMLAGAVGLGGFGRAGVVGFGGGVAYYLDSNLFFAGSLLASRLFIDDRFGNSVAKSDWGFTFEGLFGKEWWVSDNWGLGVSGQVLLGAMKDHPLANESVSTWRVTALSVLFSASYN